nr:hypothetical protein [Tanacetum cinerariifolium]
MSDLGCCGLEHHSQANVGNLLHSYMSSFSVTSLGKPVTSSTSSVVTYTSVYTDFEPGMPVAPPSPDYIPGPEEPQTPPVPQDEDEREPMFIQPHDPDHVPEPMYHEYIPLEDEHVLPAEDQPLPPVVSPTAKSPGYVVESDPEEDPEKYKDDESEDGLVDYPMDGGDDGDGDDGDSSGDETDDGDEDEDEEVEEEEHLALADSTVVVPTIEPLSLPEGTEPVIPPPSTNTTTTGAKITFKCLSLLYQSLDSSDVTFAKRQVKPPLGIIFFRSTLYMLFFLGTLIITGLAVLTDTAAFEKFYLTAITDFMPDFINTAFGTMFLLGQGVLVVKPHNKTPYEVFHDRTPMLSFMRPFGGPVTILNTIYHLGKFERKADEGLFIGYSLNNKAYRVFNSRTKIVEETLHIRFSENTPNNVGSRPNWLFDIDALIRIINYQPVVAGAQSNGNADAGFKPSNDVGKKVNEVPRQENECKDQEEKDGVNSTNRVNAISSTVNAASNEVNVVGRKSSIKLPNAPNIHELEDISMFEDSNEDDHPLEQVNRDLHSSAFSFSNKENVKELGGTRLFLAYASFKDFVVYQIDVKSAFFYGKIKEEVYVCQPPGFDDPDFPNKVYNVEKVLYGLHQALRACQDKYVAEILKKFRFSKVKTASTPMETQKPLLKDEDGEEVDVHIYRSMISSLMCLTSSRPNIMFTVCACAE